MTDDGLQELVDSLRRGAEEVVAPMRQAVETLSSLGQVAGTAAADILTRALETPAPQPDTTTPPLPPHSPPPEARPDEVFRLAMDFVRIVARSHSQGTPPSDLPEFQVLSDTVRARVNEMMSQVTGPPIPHPDDPPRPPPVDLAPPPPSPSAEPPRTSRADWIELGEPPTE